MGSIKGEVLLRLVLLIRLLITLVKLLILLGLTAGWIIISTLLNSTCYWPDLADPCWSGLNVAGLFPWLSWFSGL